MFITEVNVSDFEKTLQILEKLGFKKAYQGQKHRQSFQLGKIKFEIDTWQDIPTYLEIEAPTEKDVKAYVEKLGFTMSQTTTMNMMQLEEYYQNKK